MDTFLREHTIDLGLNASSVYVGAVHGVTSKSSASRSSSSYRVFCAAFLGLLVFIGGCGWGRTCLQTSSCSVEASKVTISWTTPTAIVYGAALSSVQLNASASQPGSFVYSPQVGTILDAGDRTLSVVFTPASAGSAIASSVVLRVEKGTPSIIWNVATAIPAGTALGAAQLNATSSVPGSFVYTPSAGNILASGLHILSTAFTPTDANNFKTVTAQLSVNVDPPTVTWPTPKSIVYGTALGNAQLNATASVPGNFAYSPASGTVLDAGSRLLSVVFTPSDGSAALTRTVNLAVVQATPKLSWATPATVSAGTVLSAAQLNATASIPGVFSYVPAAGTILTAGDQTLTVSFSPTDKTNYSQASDSIVLDVVEPLAFSSDVQLTIGANNKLSYVQGGRPPYQIHLIDGQLPSGLSIDNEGILSGVALEGGVYSVTLEISGPSAVEATKKVTITVGRDAAYWPYASDSPWNVSIGDGAVFETPLPAAGWTKSQTYGILVNTTCYGFPTSVATYSDPVRNIVRDNGNAKGTSVYIRYKTNVSDSAAPDPCGDHLLALVDPLHRTVIEMIGGFRRSDMGIEAPDPNQIDLTGSGLGKEGGDYVGASAYGGSSLAGVIRKGELLNGIHHVLRMSLSTDALNPYAPNGKHYVWPAVSADNGATTSYKGDGNLYIGTLLAIPSTVDIGKLTGSSPGKPDYELAKALQDYGAYIGDRGEFNFYSEPDAVDEVKKLTGKGKSIGNALKVVSNNFKDNIGGGGTRRRSDAPPFAPSPQP